MLLIEVKSIAYFFNAAICISISHDFAWTLYTEKTFLLQNTKLVASSAWAVTQE